MELERAHSKVESGANLDINWRKCLYKLLLNPQYLLTSIKVRTTTRTWLPVYSATVDTPIASKNGDLPSSTQVTLQSFPA